MLAAYRLMAANGCTGYGLPLHPSRKPVMVSMVASSLLLGLPLLADGIGILSGYITRNPEKEIPVCYKALGLRKTMVEYVACPSCGTLFNLEVLSSAVSNQTPHRFGYCGYVCIVNGPGEMADADYGYVGKQQVISLCIGDAKKLKQSLGLKALRN